MSVKNLRLKNLCINLICITQLFAVRLNGQEPPLKEIEISAIIDSCINPNSQVGIYFTVKNNTDKTIQVFGANCLTDIHVYDESLKELTPDYNIAHSHNFSTFPYYLISPKEEKSFMVFTPCLSYFNLYKYSSYFVSFKFSNQNRKATTKHVKPLKDCYLINKIRFSTCN